MTSSTRSVTDEPVEALLERHRVELTAFAYRMLGSASEAEDAVQETLTRAWHNFDRFEGRSKVRTWLYRIASNVCFDMLRASQRRARPMDLAGPASEEDPLGDRLTEATWILPVPDTLVLDPATDPAELAVTRESVRLAFVAALQHLPPRQRAVLILCEVLKWQAPEVAELLDTTVASVNSALQRARATMAARSPSPGELAEPANSADREMLARYVDAFQRYDMDLLTAVIHEDATQSMPPYSLWLHGRDHIFRWWLGPGIGCRGSRLVPTSANGRPAFGQYKPNEDGSGFHPWALQVLEIADGKIVDLSFFLDTERLFPLFGLPDRL